MSTATVHLFDDLILRTGARVRVVDLRDGDTVHDVLAAVVATERQREACLGAKWESLTALVDGRSVDAFDVAPVRDGAIVRAGPRARRPGDPFTQTAILIGLALLSAAASALLVTRIRNPGAENPSDGARRFGFSRFSHDAVAGDPVQVALGEIMSAGPKLLARVPVDGPDGDARVRLLYTFGRGEIGAIGSRTTNATWIAGSSVTGIYLNDNQPLANFPGSRVSIRLGQLTQRAIPGFDDTETLRDVGAGGAVLRNTSGTDRVGDVSGEAVTYSGVDPVDAMRLLIRFNAGLYSISDSGQVNSRRVQFRYRTRLNAGPGAWSGWTVHTVDRADQSTVVLSIRLDDLNPDEPPVRMDVQVERITAEASGVSVADEMTFDQVVEVQYSNNTFPGRSLLAIELTASEQISTVPNASADIRGLKNLRLWDGSSDPSSPEFDTGWSNNPADLALAWITSRDWGMGAQYSDTNINFPSLLAWRTECEILKAKRRGGTRKQFAYNALIQDARNGIDGLMKICEAGRCVPVQVGDQWHFIMDRAQPFPVEQYDDGCIACADDGAAEFTYRRGLTFGGANVPNHVVVQYPDAARQGRTDTQEWPEPDNTEQPENQLWLGGEDAEPRHTQTVRLEGITDGDQAKDEAIFRARKLRFMSRGTEFVTTKLVPAVQPGERFDLACSVAGYGMASGRLESGSVEGMVRLDRSVTLESGVEYSLQVQHHDGTLELATIAMPSGHYEAGSPLALEVPLAQNPSADGDYAGYALGAVGKAVKPFLCTGVKATGEDNGTFRWSISCVEYVPGVYDGGVGTIGSIDYSSLVTSRTPPGPVLEIRANEQVLNGIRQVTLSWRQSPADAAITASFKIYRRSAGSTAAILVPGVIGGGGRRGAIFELADLDAAYQFAAIAVSPMGACLSAFDTRIPWTGVVYGLGPPPPPPPTGLTLTQVGTGNTYTLSWDPVENATGYQVLFGGDTTGLPNVGAEDCLVLARTADTQLTGLELPPGEACRFFVRSVNVNGRMSTTASTIEEATPATPAGQTIKNTYTPDFTVDGTLTNLVWDGTDGRIELDDANTDGVFESGTIDTGAATLTELTFRPDTANDYADLTIDAFKPNLAMPSIAADQWGVVSGAGETAVVGMLMPPFPDDEQAWIFEVRTSVDGATWTGWLTVPSCSGVTHTMRYYELRITLRRKTADGAYRPALRGITVVCTD